MAGLSCYGDAAGLILMVEYQTEYWRQKQGLLSQFQTQN